MLKTTVLFVALSAAALATTPAPAQTTTQAGAAANIPNRASVTGTHRAREQHRNTLNRQRARATSAHARQVRSAPAK